METKRYVVVFEDHPDINTDATVCLTIGDVKAELDQYLRDYGDLGGIGVYELGAVVPLVVNHGYKLG